MQSLLVIFSMKLGKQEPFSHWEQYGQYSVPKTQSENHWIYNMTYKI
jgi:hypothetical protein